MAGMAGMAVGTAGTAVAGTEVDTMADAGSHRMIPVTVGAAGRCRIPGLTRARTIAIPTAATADGTGVDTVVDTAAECVGSNRLVAPSMRGCQSKMESPPQAATPFFFIIACKEIGLPGSPNAQH
jgi:hypothetical protein